jgi:hypothetical protein
MHWSEHYIGQPYEPGRADCVALAVEVQRNTFGRAVRLPTPARWAATRHDPSQLAADYGVPTEAPVDGDAVAMRCGQSWHLGVFARIGGEEWVLHATRAAGAAHLTRLRDLPAQGLRLEGFYRWA